MPDTEAGTRLLADGRVTPPERVAGMPWPATCDDCNLSTEDPDAYAVDDEEVTPERCCPLTGTEHRWATLDGVVRYVRPRDLAAIEAEARRAALAALRERVAGWTVAQPAEGGTFQWGWEGGRQKALAAVLAEIDRMLAE
jgi:hypothetical protein